MTYSSKNGTFLQKMHISPKMAHYSKNGIFLQKWHITPKMANFSKNGTLLQKWHISPKMAHPWLFPRTKSCVNQELCWQVTTFGQSLLFICSAPFIRQSCSCQFQVLIKWLPVSFNMHCEAFETESFFSLVRLFVSSLAPSPHTIPGAGTVLLEVLYLAFLPLAMQYLLSDVYPDAF